MKTVTLLSGGIDSAVCLAMMRDTDRVAIGFDYGQRHAIELDRADAIARAEGVPFEIITLPTMLKMDDVVFAGRNAVFIAVATSYAVSHGADHVVIGSNKTDYQHFPDCRHAFIGPMSVAMLEAYRVSVVAPLLQMTKREVVAKARELGIPVEETWSCYEPNGDQACGECLACQVREEALQ